MPELPEVETIVRSLRSGARHGGLHVVGQTVIAAHVLWTGTLANIEPENFITRICGQRVRSVGRRG